MTIDDNVTSKDENLNKGKKFSSRTELNTFLSLLPKNYFLFQQRGNYYLVLFFHSFFNTFVPCYFFLLISDRSHGEGLEKELLPGKLDSSGLSPGSCCRTGTGQSAQTYHSPSALKQISICMHLFRKGQA
jgi:hypothetical protein